MEYEIDVYSKKTVIAFEGIRNTYYRDHLGKGTIGIGHLVNPITEKNLINATIDNKTIDEIYIQDASIRAAWINKNCKWEDPIKKNEGDALLSFLWQYHIDDPDYANTKAAIKSGDRGKIVKQMMQFVNSKAGNGDNKMLKRREREINLFTGGKYPF